MNDDMDGESSIHVRFDARRTQVVKMLVRRGTA
jgi:hypothetical protein